MSGDARFSSIPEPDLLRASPVQDAGGVFYPTRLVAHVCRRGEFGQPLEYATHIETFPPGQPSRLSGGEFFRFASNALRSFERRWTTLNAPAPEASA